MARRWQLYRKSMIRRHMFASLHGGGFRRCAGTPVTRRWHAEDKSLIRLSKFLGRPHLGSKKLQQTKLAFGQWKIAGTTASFYALPISERRELPSLPSPTASQGTMGAGTQRALK
jgi:hypothetical protein